MENDRPAKPANPARDAADEPRPGIPSDERIGTLIFAIVLTLFGLFWVYASLDLPNRQQTAYLSQGFMPITAGILLAVLSAMLAISTWRTKSRPAAELGREPLFEPKAEARGAAVFAVAARLHFDPAPYPLPDFHIPPDGDRALSRTRELRAAADLARRGDERAVLRNFCSGSSGGTAWQPIRLKNRDKR